MRGSDGGVANAKPKYPPMAITIPWKRPLEETIYPNNFTQTVMNCNQDYYWLYTLVIELYHPSIKLIITCNKVDCNYIYDEKYVVSYINQ